MKLKIEKTKSVQSNEGHWNKTTYSLETEIQADMLEIERKRLESLVDMWLGTPSVSTPNTLPKPTKKVKVAGKCYDCGKPSGQYYRCYECNLKFKGETK